MRSGYVSFELTIKNVTLEDFGEYECFIYEYSSVKTAKIKLEPHERKHLELSSARNVIAVEIGYEWEFIFNVSAYPLPSFKWYDPNGQERKNLWDLKDCEINNESFSVGMRIPRAYFEDFGTHTVVADNSEITTNITFDLKVIAKPEITISEIYPVGNYEINQSIEFQCHASGYPTPSLMWEYEDFNNGLIGNSLESGKELFQNETKLTGETTVASTITIKMVKSGMIKCKACDTEECIRFTVQMVNVFDPKITCDKLNTSLAPCENVQTGPSLGSNSNDANDLIMTSQHVNASEGGSVSIQCGFSVDKFRRESILWRSNTTSLVTNGNSFSLLTQ
uniref:Ig-like domain-containing protein n=1 Tax=Glyptapanteles indiensis TaxID=92994 RepID=B7S8S3_GLYIN|nr:hypothetical protein GIP_L3_0010 [Glyptapanteles indiensis]